METKKKIGWITITTLLVIVVLVVTKNSSPVLKQNKPTLAKVVQDAMAGTQGTYGIVIKNLKTGETYYSNEHRTFQPGSLYKLWIMAETYKQIESGQILPDEILTNTIEQLNTDFGIPPETAELTEGTITLSVHDALEQMITISHNYAAFLLIERTKISSTLSQTTASEVAVFLEKLYKEGGEPIALLKRQQLNEITPKYLPENIEVAHKTGIIDTFDNDAGIVYGPKGDYIIVLLSESDDPPGAEERMAKLSKAVYDYFNSQTNPGK